MTVMEISRLLDLARSAERALHKAMEAAFLEKPDERDAWMRSALDIAENLVCSMPVSGSQHEQ